MTNLLLIQALNGLQFGILLFLIAAGLTLIFGIMDFVNLAHGAFYMLGAYIVATAAARTDSLWLSIFIMLPLIALIGILVEKFILHHLYRKSHLHQLLATLGLTMAVNETVKILWGTAPLDVPVPQILDGTVSLFGLINYPLYRLFIIVVGSLVAIGLFLLINFTRVGMLLRAGTTHRQYVSALGINIDRLFSVLFAFGCALAGFAGAMIAPLVSVEYSMGDSVLILTFVVIVIGGVGSIKGAFLGAVLVGFVDTLGRTLGPIVLRSIVEPQAASQLAQVLGPMLVYMLMACVLVFNPSGLLGRPTRG